jgi:hypothetical protein
MMNLLNPVNWYLTNITKSSKIIINTGKKKPPEKPEKLSRWQNPKGV